MSSKIDRYFPLSRKNLLERQKNVFLSKHGSCTSHGDIMNEFELHLWVHIWCTQKSLCTIFKHHFKHNFKHAQKVTCVCVSVSIPALAHLRVSWWALSPFRENSCLLCVCFLSHAVHIKEGKDIFTSFCVKISCVAFLWN